MGTFIGHIIPGGFFMFFAIWNLVRTALNPPSRPPEPPQARRKRLCHLLRNPVFIEGTVKVIATVAAGLGDLWWGSWKMINYGKFVSLNNYQHATMYSFFGLAGVVEVLSVTCVKFQPGQEKLFQATAFFVEGFLFYFHLHGRSAVDVRLHILLAMAILGCTVGSLLEALAAGNQSRANLFFRYLWIVCTFLQGTWFIQTGFVLYNPWRSGSNPWAGDEYSALGVLTAAYAWHILLAVFVAMFVNTISYVCIRIKQRVL